MGKNGRLTDEEIIDRIGRGDPDAVSDLYHRYAQPIFRYLLEITPDRTAAEEILQDTFIAVWRSAQRFERRSSVRTWLMGVARRQAHNLLRRRGLPLTDLSELEAEPAAGPGPEEIVLARAARDELVDAFRGLSVLHREVLTLAFLEELSTQEIAALLNVPLATVKSRLRNARRALLARLAVREQAER